MAGTKDLYFDPNDLLQLICHYTDGEVPMNGQVTDFLVNEHLGRVIGLVVLSDEWDTSDMLHVRYDTDHRSATWAKNEGGEMVWAKRNENPQRQN